MILDRILQNIGTKYYESNKKVLKDKARDKYRNLSNEEKNKKREYGRDRYHNMSGVKNTETKRTSKHYREAKKSQSSN